MAVCAFSTPFSVAPVPACFPNLHASSSMLGCYIHACNKAQVTALLVCFYQDEIAWNGLSINLLLLNWLDESLQVDLWKLFREHRRLTMVIHSIKDDRQDFLLEKTTRAIISILHRPSFWRYHLQAGICDQTFRAVAFLWQSEHECIASVACLSLIHWHPCLISLIMYHAAAVPKPIASNLVFSGCRLMATYLPE